ncbi:hypothetical protein [Leptolyngbya ohadii]|uniref:hypothetical protein n=1 Tax=Leptolyngbya ohadii TaxID=1962290 RepID=UPI000B59DEA2|nr:hypothetical protein [Leptolyngbya ohadii]
MRHVDYLAIGSRTYPGNPKTPTVFVYQLDDHGVYHGKGFKGDDRIALRHSRSGQADRIISPTFPDLALTMNQILEV